MDEYYEGWIDGYRGRTSRGLEETTRDSYRESFDRHVLPYPLARQRMRDVTSRDVSDWFTELERSGVRPPSIRKAKAAVSADVRHCRSVGRHRRQSRRRRPLRPQRSNREAQEAHARHRGRASDPLGTPGRTETVLRAACDVRATGGGGPWPTWANVHLGDDARLFVTEQVYKGKRKRLQTEGSERTIPLSSGLARALTSWRDASASSEPGDPVFASSVGTPLSYGNVYNRVLRPALRASGIAVRVGDKWDYQGVGFHAFRKACGSMLLLRAGKDPRQVQQWLGHSQLTTTMNVYVHELDGGLGGADELDALLRGHGGAIEGPQTAASPGDPAKRKAAL